MPYHPDHFRQRPWPLAAVALILVCGGLLFAWSFTSGKRRVLTAPAPSTVGGTASAPIGPGGTSAPLPVTQP